MNNATPQHGTDLAMEIAKAIWSRYYLEYSEGEYPNLSEVANVIRALLDTPAIAPAPAATGLLPSDDEVEQWHRTQCSAIYDRELVGNFMAYLRSRHPSPASASVNAPKDVWHMGHTVTTGWCGATDRVTCDWKRATCPECNRRMRANIPPSQSASPAPVVEVNADAAGKSAQAERLTTPPNIATEGYYILCCRHGYCDGMLLWWRKGGSGYTPHLHEAGVYSEEKALDIVRGCHNDDKMIPAAKVAEISKVEAVKPAYRFASVGAEDKLKRVGNAIYWKLIARAGGKPDENAGQGEGT